MSYRARIEIEKYIYIHSMYMYIYIWSFSTFLLEHWRTRRNSSPPSETSHRPRMSWNPHGPICACGPRGGRPCSGGSASEVESPWCRDPFEGLGGLLSFLRHQCRKPNSISKPSKSVLIVLVASLQVVEDQIGRSWTANIRG